MAAQIHPKTLSFLKNLKNNNNKPWFDKHKPQYDEIRNEFILFIDELINRLNKTDNTIGEQEASKCIYRIYRDLRFSKDKTPYKKYIAASVARGGRKSNYAGYYVHIEPGGNSYFGAGVWHPEPKDLQKIRQEIDYNLNDYKKIVEKRSFVKAFGEPFDDKQKTVPQTYAADNPAIEYLKYRSFIYGADFISDKTVTSLSFMNELTRMAKELSPFVLFLNRAME